MEDGEPEWMHELSSEFWTLKTVVAPPERPLESTIVKTSCVSKATSAVQLYDDDPFGGLIMMASPDGIRP